MVSTRQLYVSEIVNKCKRVLGLSDWIINITIKDSDHPTDERCEAEIDDDLKYLEADLIIYNRFWLNDSDHQEINIFHELVHLHLCPLHPYLPPAADDVLEGVVQKLAVVFKNL